MTGLQMNQQFQHAPGLDIAKNLPLQAWGVDIAHTLCNKQLLYLKSDFQDGQAWGVYIAHTLRNKQLFHLKSDFQDGFTE